MYEVQHYIYLLSVQPWFNYLNHDLVTPVQSTARFLKHWFCHKQRRGKNWINRIIYLLQSVLVFLGIQKTKTPGKGKTNEGIFGLLLCHHSSSWFGCNLHVFFTVFWLQFGTLHLQP